MKATPTPCRINNGMLAVPAGEWKLLPTPQPPTPYGMLCLYFAIFFFFLKPKASHESMVFISWCISIQEPSGNHTPPQLSPSLSQSTYTTGGSLDVPHIIMQGDARRRRNENYFDDIPRSKLERQMAQVRCSQPLWCVCLSPAAGNAFKYWAVAHDGCLLPTPKLTLTISIKCCCCILCSLELAWTSPL